MASKWKKRLKKIGKIAAIAGIAALAAKGLGKGKGKGAVTGVVNPNAPKTDWITKKDAVPKRAADTVTTGGSYLSRMGGAGDLATKLANQRKRAALAQRGRGINPHEETAAAGAAYRPGVVRPGGRLNIKHGGRTSKQFGGGLNRPIARPIGGVAGPVGGVGAGVGAPVRPLAYKKGGHVKSMGAAKRGGGVAKK